MNYWQRQARRNEVYENGVAVVVPEFEGWTFFVRPLTLWNTYYKTAAARIAKVDPDVMDYLKRAAEPDYETNDADRVIDRRMSRQAFIEGCLVRWEGVTDEDGNLLEFSNVTARLTFDYFPDLANYLDSYVANPANFPQLTEDEKASIALGNSEPALSSNSELGGMRSEPLPATKKVGTHARRKK